MGIAWRDRHEIFSWSAVLTSGLLSIPPTVRAHKLRSGSGVLDDHEIDNGGVFETRLKNIFTENTYSEMKRLRRIF